MTRNEDKQQKPEIVSESLLTEQNQQVASAMNLGDAPSVCLNIENRAVVESVVNDGHGLNSACMLERQDQSDLLASEGPATIEIECIVNEDLHCSTEDALKNSPLGGMVSPHEGVDGSNHVVTSSFHVRAGLNQNTGNISESLSHEPSKTYHESGFRLVEVEVLQNLPDPLISLQQNFPVNVEPIFEVVEICPEDGTNCLVTEQFELPVEVISNVDHLETPTEGKSTVRSDHRNKRKSARMKKNYKSARIKKNYKSARMKKKYSLRSSLGKSNRGRKSRKGEKVAVLELNDQIGEATASEASKRTRRRKKRTRIVTGDEYLKIKKNLCYMLNRIKYEQSLIDAYSSEGWKGLSLEKLKPEKELQRASSEIIRRKVRIRDLFQRLDTMCAEGRLPEALFDEEGMIDSEDIFCAKCGSKDLTLDNDIILCDGACERGFHQFCLEPPLRKEDVPPDDVGWLCPGCDCKVECLDILNESQGTKVSIADDWKKVFPEAVKGGNQGPASELSSEDSKDEDFDPGRQQTDGIDRGDESSSDDSEYAASEISEPHAKDDPYLGLPSDDSEDDDYDPDAPKPDIVKEEGSSSDFTSDSEDLKDAFVEDDLHGSNGVPRSSSSKGRRGRKISKGGHEGQAEDKSQSLLESEPDESGAPTTISVRRQIERLDYKMLYEETYGRSSGSSDDEDWTDTSPKKHKRSDEDEEQQREDDGVIINSSHGRQKSESTGTPAAAKSTATKNRLGEDAKKRLHEAFLLNHYPDRATKENLAADLGISCLQVNKWFAHARWSCNHPSGRTATASTDADEKDTLTTRLPKPDSELDWEILPNVAQTEGNLGASVSVSGSCEKEAKGKKLLEQSKESNIKAVFTPAKKRGRPRKDIVTTSLPNAVSKLDGEILPNGAQTEGLGASVSVAGNRGKDAQRTKLLEQNKESNSKAVSTPAKKRGRPRKATVAQTINQTSGARKRGRPRKAMVAQTINQTSGSQTRGKSAP